MKSNKQYRFKDNPQEKILHDKFVEMFGKTISGHKMLSSIIYGWEDSRQIYPVEFIDNDGECICVNLIQWLGSPVGQGFLSECGYELKQSK